ncbi:MAG: helix-turn-helix transcriptional regulator [Promethearchaeota archaeon]
MIRRVKEFRSSSLIASSEYRSFLENFESEILRGVSTLMILKIISDSGEKGTYGYRILQDLERRTNKMLVVEEGTLYPILRKLEKESLLRSYRKEWQGRSRKYYFLTDFGTQVLNHALGFFMKFIEGIAPLAGIKEVKISSQFYFCPNCANKIDLKDDDVHFCEVCGLNLEPYKKKVVENE